MPTLAELNALPAALFAERLGGIFEHSPWVAEAVAGQRPFADLDALHAAMVAAVAAADSTRQIALIRAHPDLAGKAARAGRLTQHSTSEQASAGLDRLSDAEFERFERLNGAYREKFGFPFIICVRKTDKAGILAAYEERLGNDAAREMRRALAEIAEIARLRLDQAVAG